MTNNLQQSIKQKMQEFQSTYSELLKHPQFHSSKCVALFCNHTAFDFVQKKYLFDLLIEQNKLKSILIPEHGLFANHQDQVKIDSTQYQGIECVSLYQKKSLNKDQILIALTNSDALVIDIQEVGVRYYTYVTHLFLLLSTIHNSKIDLPIFIMDRPNLIGSAIEGTMMPSKYASLLGFEGLIHRHGMRITELCHWFLINNKIDLAFTPVQTQHDDLTFYIPPSPNLPAINSLQVYPGQCFWESTTFSEGRGTTNPFEIIGHPDLKQEEVILLSKTFNHRFRGQAFLRHTSFIPVAHKHQNKLCRGWHLYIEDVENYHTIFGSLYLMRIAKELMPSMKFWLSGPYEYDSDLEAAQTIIGDDLLIRYVDGQENESTLLDRLELFESKWKKIRLSIRKTLSSK